MSRSAAPLGSLRSPRPAAERKSGHFTCAENRTFYLLPTKTLAERRLGAHLWGQVIRFVQWVSRIAPPGRQGAGRLRQAWLSSGERATREPAATGKDPL